MLRHRGERHREARREIADRSLAGREARDDRTPGRVRERGERVIEAAGVVNHAV
jgi:hypothetical protein